MVGRDLDAESFRGATVYDQMEPGSAGSARRLVCTHAGPGPQAAVHVRHGMKLIASVAIRVYLLATTIPG